MPMVRVSNGGTKFLDFIGFSVTTSSYPSGTANLYFDCQHANKIKQIVFDRGSYGTVTSLSFTIYGSASTMDRSVSVKQQSLPWTSIYNNFPSTGTHTVDIDITNYKTLYVRMEIANAGGGTPLTGCNLIAE